MTALILFALAQAPTEVPVAIVVSSRRDTGTQASTLAEQLKVALAAEGITATSDADSVARLKKLGGVDPRACDGARLCLQKLAQLMQGVVIGVDVSKAGRLSAGHLEAVAWERVESLAADDLTSDAKSWPAKSKDGAKAFAQKLKGPLAELNEARKVKASSELKGAPVLEPPQQARLVPEPPPVPPPTAPPTAVQAEPAQKSNLGPVAYVTTAAAIISAGAGIVCMILGFLDRGTYFSTLSRFDGSMDMASSYDDRQLLGLANQSNLRVGLGAGLIGLGAALGITSAVLFTRE